LLILSLNFENMTIKDILNCITEVAPLHWQESYDNAGLQVGDLNSEACKALICLDITEEVVDEAIAKHDIAMISMHTNLDNSYLGVSRVLAEQLGLKKLHLLQPSESEPELCGAGMVGEFEKPEEEVDFLNLVADTIGSPCLRHSALTGRRIQKVALCGGAGVPFMQDALRQKVDAYLTADIKYHDFFVPEGNILLVDGGHFETEQFTKELICELIRKKFPTFAAEIAETKTNSVHYFVKN